MMVKYINIYHRGNEKMSEIVKENVNETGNESVNENQEEKKESKLKNFLGTCAYIVVIFLILFVVIQLLVVRTKVTSTAMDPTLQEKDNIVVEKVSYFFGDPERFDVVIFPFEDEKGTYFIKRIIGMPGETIQIDEEGTILINGEALDESYGNAVMESAGEAAQPITLGEDEYFVLGDNRNDNADSRHPMVGNVNGDEIIGRVWLRFWPEFNLVK